MIVTLTPNPSFDLTLKVGELEPGELHRAESAITEAGGKGINVSRALALAGVESKCLFPANRTDSARLESMLGTDALSGVLDPIAIAIVEEVRTNVTLAGTSGQTTKINAPGPVLSEDEALQMRDVAVRMATTKESSWLAACGSLPRGVSAEFFGSLREAVGPSVSVAIDTSGDALEAAVRRGCDLIKPNQGELAVLTGRQLATIGDVIEACRAIIGSGVGQVLASLGSSGAILVSAEHEIHATGPSVEVLNTVGAGDATLAGFLSVGGRGPIALQTGVAWGAAAVQSPNTRFDPPSQAGVDSIHLADPVWETELNDGD